MDVIRRFLEKYGEKRYDKRSASKISIIEHGHDMCGFARRGPCGGGGGVAPQI